MVTANAMPALRLCGLSPVRGSVGARHRWNRSVSARRRGHATGARAFTVAEPIGIGARDDDAANTGASARHDRRGALHRLHLVHPGVSRGRGCRRGATPAYRARIGLYRLRVMHRAVPGRLHRLGSGATYGTRCTLADLPGARCHRGAGRLCRARTSTCAAAQRNTHPPRGARARTRTPERRRGTDARAQQATVYTVATDGLAHRRHDSANSGAPLS